MTERIPSYLAVTFSARQYTLAFGRISQLLRGLSPRYSHMEIWTMCQRALRLAVGSGGGLFWTPSCWSLSPVFVGEPSMANGCNSLRRLCSGASPQRRRHRCLWPCHAVQRLRISHGISWRMGGGRGRQGEDSRCHTWSSAESSRRQVTPEGLDGEHLHPLPSHSANMR